MDEHEDDEIEVELLPHERKLILKLMEYDESVTAQLKAQERNPNVATIKFNDIHFLWLTQDLCHAIVKEGWRSKQACELCERLERILEDGDGSLEAWSG